MTGDLAFDPRRPGQRALRKGRVSLPGQAYVVTTATHARRPLFEALVPGRIVVGEMRRLHAQGAVNSLAFVVMPDHLHWLFTIGEGTRLPDVVRALKGRSARRLSEHAAPPIWQRGYFDHGLKHEADLRAQARYIVANPLRAGLAETLGDYPLWDAIWLDDTLLS